MRLHHVTQRSLAPRPLDNPLDIFLLERVTPMAELHPVGEQSELDAFGFLIVSVLQQLENNEVCRLSVFLDGGVAQP
jgi:hypothetical protein